MGDELVFNTCLEDVRYFIERFERRAADPNGRRFKAPLDRLRQLQERIEHLRELAEVESPRASATQPGGVGKGAFEERLNKLQESVEQRFSRLNLTVSSILENLTSIPRNLEMGLRGINETLQKIDADLGTVKEAGEKQGRQLSESQEGLAAVNEKIDQMAMSASSNDEVLGGVDDLTSDMNELKNHLQALEIALTTTQAEFRSRSVKQSEVLHGVREGTDNVQHVFNTLLSAIAAVQWPSKTETVFMPPGVSEISLPPVQSPGHHFGPKTAERSLTETLNLTASQALKGTMLATNERSYESTELPRSDEGDRGLADLGDTIQMSAEETAQLVRNAKNQMANPGNPDDEETTLGLGAAISEAVQDTQKDTSKADEFKFTLDDVEI
jgi:hypothetical protein